MPNGQADSAPATIDSLADFLEDIPATEPDTEEDDTPADAAPDEDKVDDANDESETPDEDAEDAPDEDEPTPAEQKITVKIKGEDGTEETLELTPDEIASSYMRQKDYTKKTQALSEREGQAVQLLTTKHDEIVTSYTQKAEFALSAVKQMAGLRTEAEMSQLAQTDPAAWVAENQRQQSVRNFLNTLDQSIQGERKHLVSRQQQQEADDAQRMFEASWVELSKEKIDKPALSKIYETAAKNYGFALEQFGGVYDHKVVLALRDANAYRALKNKAPEVTKKANEAPRMPTSKQATPAAERQRNAVNARFKSGKGKLNDLAAYLSL